ncbi:MAG TPA: hypothetical protein VN478_05760 [Clostridia bacterium]|nr:hypothetical protein [Clostridia bacterium]
MIGCTSWLVPGTWLENARVAKGLVDYDELLVASWDAETRSTLEREIPDLLTLDLKYTVHLPYPDASHAWEAYDFFESREFPVLNYVLHPMAHWRDYAWGDRVALENLKETLEPCERMVFDVGHHLLGKRVPDEWKSRVVEVHAMGVRDGRDHLALDSATAAVVLPWVADSTLLTFEVFDLDALVTSLHTWEACRAG